MVPSKSLSTSYGMSVNSGFSYLWLAKTNRGSGATVMLNASIGTPSSNRSRISKDAAVCSDRTGIECDRTLSVTGSEAKSRWEM